MPASTGTCSFAPQRRAFLAKMSGLACLAGVCSLASPLGAAALSGGMDAGLDNDGQTKLIKKISQIEKLSGGRLGAARLDCATGSLFAYRGDEAFPMCSTFKILAAAAVLKLHPQKLNNLVRLTPDEIVAWSPVTEKFVNKDMPVKQLCAAALQYSDNTAANLLLGMIGGPSGLTAFARSLGDGSFRLDRMEPALNSAEPGDIRDTTSPAAMAITLNALLMGAALPLEHRTLLRQWLTECATGASRMPAGAPVGWKVGHKTGSGANGTSNDVGILLPPSGTPVILALYLTQCAAAASDRDAILAATTSLLCPAGA